MNEHSLPWRVNTDASGKTTIVDATGNAVVSEPMFEDRAAYIVDCANAREALVLALCDASELLGKLIDGKPIDAEAVLCTVNKALTKSEMPDFVQPD